MFLPLVHNVNRSPLQMGKRSVRLHDFYSVRGKYSSFLYSSHLHIYCRQLQSGSVQSAMRSESVLCVLELNTETGLHTPAFRFTPRSRSPSTDAFARSCPLRWGRLFVGHLAPRPTPRHPHWWRLQYRREIIIYFILTVKVMIKSS